MEKIMVTIEGLDSLELIVPKLEELEVSSYRTGYGSDKLVDGTASLWFNSAITATSMYLSIAVPTVDPGKEIIAIRMADMAWGASNWHTNPKVCTWRVSGFKDGEEIVVIDPELTCTGAGESFDVDLSHVDMSTIDTVMFNCTYCSRNVQSGNNKYYVGMSEVKGWSIAGKRVETYKTYTKDPTTGEVTLEMSNPSDVVSPLGSSSIVEDLKNMSTRVDFDTMIHDVESGIMGPRVDTFEQLPPSTIQESYTAPELRNGNGTPFVDEYAVSSSSIFSILDTYMGTYRTGDPNVVWHSANTGSGWFRMTFKNPLKANKLLIVNRTIGSDNIYAIGYFDVKAKSGEEWVTLYSGTNQNGSGVENTYEFENDEFYREYELTIRTTYGGSAGSYISADLIQLSGISGIPNPDIQRGKVYFVGTADAEHFDKYMIGPDGEWTEVNPAEMQGVDLRDYSTIQSVTDTLAAKQIETGTAVATMKQEVTEDMSSLGTVVADSDKKDIKVVYTLPETWPSDLKDTATILLMKDTE